MVTDNHLTTFASLELGLNPYSTGSWLLIQKGGKPDRTHHKCLNPYSTGSWLLMKQFMSLKGWFASLNPYSTGSWLLIFNTSVESYKLERS